MEEVDFQRMLAEVEFLDDDQLSRLQFAVYVKTLDAHMDEMFRQAYAEEASATAQLVGDEGPTSYQTIRGE